MISSNLTCLSNDETHLSFHVDSEGGFKSMPKSCISTAEAAALIHRDGCDEHDGISALLQLRAYVLRDGRVVVMDHDNSKLAVAILWDNIDELLGEYSTSVEEDVVVSDVIATRFASAESFIRQIDDWISRLEGKLNLEHAIVLTRDCVRMVDDRFEHIGEQCLNDVVVFCGLTALIGEINCRTKAAHWGIEKYGTHVAPANINSNGSVEFPFDGLLRIEDGSLWGDGESPLAFRPIELCTNGWSMCLP